jgi:hypothetical protein
MEITDRFVALVTAAHAYATERQDELRRDFRLGTWQRYDWDQGTGQLTFSADGIVRVVADIQFVGTVSTVSSTWLWAWANPRLEPAVARDVAEVRRYGEEHDIAQLTTPKWAADENDGWEMTSISAYLLRARGLYRAPREGGFTYMVLTGIRWAAESEVR